ncbi:WD repeat-containing protein 6 isoform X2 [Pectinophora gossypiella]|uniref:WD repeat-containing protein 6 isoform X2 n=1 Tax=Pectinophora gossypiella TaxID=13191 RepID=UPI00214E0E45|nr:WD repeat-containing protein 6 isoform X2 [Pectinophora gossypiella]
MSLFTRTDVTAVKLYQNYIFSGVGSFVNVYDKVSAKLLMRIEVLTIGTSESGIELDRVVDPIICDDWLHSAVWIDHDTVALLTAHNVVQKWSISNKVELSSHHSKDNSILYSGLLLPVQDDLVVFAGTVFSVVIIYRCGSSTPLHHLEGHRGVIFSISCDPQKEIIVTTSDDRSVRIWGIHNKLGYPKNTLDYWDNVTIEHRNKVYGHTARVMRNFITEKLIISVGEDSAICYWDVEGTLLRKVDCHQNATIWSLDADERHVVTAGGDSGIILHPLTAASDCSQKESLNIIENPKMVIFTAKRHIIVINESNKLVYYNVAEKIKSVEELNHESTYKMVAMSSCRELIAICDMTGKVNIFSESNTGTCLQSVVDTNVQLGRLRSLHWVGNTHLVFCNDDGVISVFKMKDQLLSSYGTFTLPSSKEKWLTACAIDFKEDILLCSDRCGNLHIFKRQESKPIKTWNKATCRYGATSIIVKEDVILTTGRDGHVNIFQINSKDLTQSGYLSSKEIQFQWVEKFLDSEHNLLCGFQERTFVVLNLKTDTKIVEFECGGGHRSWDAVHYWTEVSGKKEEYIRMIYIKQSTINSATFELSKILSKNIVNGSQSKAINCLKTYKTHLDSSMTYYISGGEDTTVRLSGVNKEMAFEDLVTYRQLSNIRTLKTYQVDKNRLLAISAGGRAQICINEFKFEKCHDRIKVSSQELVNYMIKGSELERKRNKSNSENDFDPETRVMDLDIIMLHDSFIIFAGCSDAYLRAFKCTKNNTISFKEFKVEQTPKTCILKVQNINVLNKDLLVTCTTIGEVVFWHVFDLATVRLEVILSLRPHQCGINCIAYKTFLDKILIATGSDDNSIHLNLLQMTTNPSKQRDISLKVVHSWSTDKFHSSQITGLVLLDSVMVSTSIDQRITVFHWEATDDEVKCEFVSQVYSDVADIHGLDIVEAASDSVTVCVFGKGMEVIRLSTETVKDIHT